MWGLEQELCRVTDDCLTAPQIAARKAKEQLMTQLRSDAPEAVFLGRGLAPPSLMGLRAQSHTTLRAHLSPGRGLHPKPHHLLSLCVHLSPHPGPHLQQ